MKKNGHTDNGTNAAASVTPINGLGRLNAAAILQMKTLTSKRDKLARQHRIAAMELETFLLKEMERMNIEIAGPINVSEDGVITKAVATQS